MALKFLNKKGWHTGSLRNIENVWKAEQKHDAEQKKLEELKKQIQEERERSEFRQLQEQAGLVPRQERLDFLYESGLGVGKGSSDGFKALEAPSAPPAAPTAAGSAATAVAEGSSAKAAVPGALFVEEKPQSANDAWRKLHSDPLLLIRQREQEALSRIKNNPIRMAMIRKSVEAEKKHREEKKGKRGKKEKKHKRKHKHSKARSEMDSDSKTSSESEDDRRKRHRTTSEREQDKGKRHSSNIGEEEEERRKDDPLTSDRNRSYSNREKHSSRRTSDSRYSKEYEEDRSGRSTSERHHRYGGINSSKLHENEEEKRKNIGEEEERRKGDHLTSDRNRSYSNHEKHPSRARSDSRYSRESEEDRNRSSTSKLHKEEEEKGKNVPPTSNRHQPGPGSKNGETYPPQKPPRPGYSRPRGAVPKMTEEEREARLREMQLDAELHEEQRWKRVKKAAEADAQEAARAASSSGGKNFLDSAQRSIYGTEKGGSSTIEESVRRRAYYSQGGTRDHETNAFRR